MARRVKLPPGKGELALMSENSEALMGGSGGRKVRVPREEQTESVTLNWMNRGPFGGCESSYRGLRFVVTEMGKTLWALDVYGEGGLVVSKTYDSAYRCRLEAQRMVGS